jgi:hypothetical protein
LKFFSTNWSIKSVFVLSWFFCFSFWNDWLPVQTVQRHVPLIAIYSSEESVCFERQTKNNDLLKVELIFSFFLFCIKISHNFASNAFNVEFVILCHYCNLISNYFSDIKLFFLLFFSSSVIQLIWRGEFRFVIVFYQLLFCFILFSSFSFSRHVSRRGSEAK